MTILPKQSARSHWAALLFFAAFFVQAGAPIDAERAAELKVTPIGTRLAGTTQIPAFSVDSRTGLDLGPDDRALAELPVLPRTIKAKSLSWIHLTGYGWLLIPKGWRVVDGGVGADGSMMLIAQANQKANPKSGASWLEYRDAGQCVGCAISAANCFYPQAHAQAIENEFDLDACSESSSATDIAAAAGKRVPALQYQRVKSKDGTLQTLRHYRDLDGISYQQLRVQQPSSLRAGAEKIDLKSDALGIFFKRIWVAAE